MSESIYLVASGDLRLSANQKCWPAQERVEQAVISAVQREGRQVVRAHPYNPALQHGFIDSQRHGMEAFRGVPPEAPLLVVEAVWQYSHHVLSGLYSHRGPILTVANWSGEWPGLVGMLNLNGSLTKAGVPYSSLWSVDFTDDFFLHGLRQWLRDGKIVHDTSHVRPLADFKISEEAARIAAELARQLKRDKAILGVFDEGCMGMYNAIIPDELLHPVGVFKERLSQSALYAAMLQVSDAESLQVRRWLDAKGMRFCTGKNADSDLTDEQIFSISKGLRI
jgi:hypothetical protein